MRSRIGKSGLYARNPKACRPRGGAVWARRAASSSSKASSMNSRARPGTIRAQLEGGVMFGLSAALFNEITIVNGRVRQSNFHDFRALRLTQAPRVEVYLIASQESPGGVGETGTACVAAALCNAIYAATGRRLRSLPVIRSFSA